LHGFPNVLGVFGRGRDRVGNRDGGHGDGARSCTSSAAAWESWVGEVEEEEVEGRDVMDALQAGAPATHGTRLETPELHLG
jgi:hypothetical protein